MLKTDSLREAMTRSCRWCQANPENSPFSGAGNIETTGETPSFVYRYQMVMFVMDYAGELDDPHAAATGVVIRKSATVVAQSGA